jgi:hypothetical protein
MTTNAVLSEHLEAVGAHRNGATSYLLVQGELIAVVQAMEAQRCATMRPVGNTVRGFQGFRPADLVTFTATGHATSSAMLSVVEVRRDRGDADKFHTLMERVGIQLGPKLRAMVHERALGLQSARS